MRISEAPSGAKVAGPSLDLEELGAFHEPASALPHLHGASPFGPTGRVTVPGSLTQEGLEAGGRVVRGGGARRPWWEEAAGAARGSPTTSR
jgi:hypothetical protein